MFIGMVGTPIGRDISRLDNFTSNLPVTRCTLESISSQAFIVGKNFFPAMQLSFTYVTK